MSPAIQRLLELAARAAALGDADRSRVISDHLRSRVHGQLVHLMESDLDESRHLSLLEFVESNLALLDQDRLPLQPGFGQVVASSLTSELAFANLCLLLVGLGGRGTFAFQADDACTMYVDAVPFRVGGLARVESDGSRCRVASSSGDLLLQYDGVAWRPDEVQDGRSMPLTVCSSTTETSLLVDLIGDLELSPASTAEVAGSLASALELVALSPRYRGWIASVLRAVVFVAAPPAATASGSSEWFPGVIFASYPMAADHLAAQLVHESAHQYLYIASAARPLVDPGSSRQCYSPFKGCDRPVYGVLLALHAAVHIRNFLGDIEIAGHSSEYVCSEREQLDTHIVSMLADLKGIAELTPEGSYLVEQLVQEASVLAHG